MRFVESRGAPPAFVQPFQDVVDQFCGDVWTHRFPRLAPSQQLYAIGMVRALLGRIHTLKPQQVVRPPPSRLSHAAKSEQARSLTPSSSAALQVAQLADILPMNSPSQASWKHAPTVRPSSLSARSSAADPPLLARRLKARPLPCALSLTAPRLDERLVRPTRRPRWRRAATFRRRGVRGGRARPGRRWSAASATRWFTLDYDCELARGFCCSRRRAGQDSRSERECVASARASSVDDS